MRVYLTTFELRDIVWELKSFLGFRGLIAGWPERSAQDFFCVHGGKKAREVR